MTKRLAKKFFEAYNPIEKITECPDGRVGVRKLLDIYAKAAVNLYGIILRKELAEIFSMQNAEQTTSEEIFSLLLPLVYKNEWYCFYKDYIVHSDMIENFDYAEYLIQGQSGKPRYVPERDEFPEYQDEYYEDKKQKSYWDKIFSLVEKEWPDNEQKYDFFHALKDMAQMGEGNLKIGQLQDKYNIVFENDEKAKQFVNLLMEAFNNTRIWINKGYSPDEMYNARNGE